MPRKKTQEEFELEVKELTEGRFIVIGKYVGSLEDIKMYHKECGTEFEVKPSIFLRRKGCPECKENKKKKYKVSHEEFVLKVEESIGKGYLILGEYQGTKNKVKIKHTKCGDIRYKYPHDIYICGERLSYMQT